MALTLWKNSDNRLIKNDAGTQLIKCDQCPCGSSVNGYLRVNYSVAQPPSYWDYAISGGITSPINVPITFSPRTDDSVVWGETKPFRLNESTVYTGSIDVTLKNTSPDPTYDMTGSVTIYLFEGYAATAFLEFSLETNGSTPGNAKISFQLFNSSGYWILGML